MTWVQSCSQRQHLMWMCGTISYEWIGLGMEWITTGSVGYAYAYMGVGYRLPYDPKKIEE